MVGSTFDWNTSRARANQIADLAGKYDRIVFVTAIPTQFLLHEYSYD